MSRASITPRVLLDGLAYVESPRWHDGRLWFPHWGTDEVLAVDLDGKVEVVAHRPSSGLGDGIAFLPDGRLLITGDRLMRQEPDGSLVEHSDLSHLTKHGWSEITVDGRGNIYVNSINFDFMAGAQPTGAPGIVALITPDGAVRQVADGIAFPNGMVVSPDNETLIIAESFAAKLTAFEIAQDGTLSNRRTWAEGVGPDGICMDADGAIYCSSKPGEKNLLRVREGGEVSDRIELDRFCFATALGGPGRQTLFMMCAEWDGPTGSKTPSSGGRVRYSSPTPRRPVLAGLDLDPPPESLTVEAEPRERGSVCDEVRLRASERLASGRVAPSQARTAGPVLGRAPRGTRWPRPSCVKR